MWLALQATDSSPPMAPTRSATSVKSGGSGSSPSVSTVTVRVLLSRARETVVIAASTAVVAGVEGGGNCCVRRHRRVGTDVEVACDA